MGPSSPPSLCPQKEGHLEKISTSFFSTVLAGYQSCRTHQDTQGSAQGFPIRTSYLGLRRQLESPVSTPCLNHLSCKDMIRFTMKWIPWGRPRVPGVEPQPLDIQCPTALAVSLFHLGWVWRDGYGSCTECLPLLFLWMQQCEASGGQFCHLREAMCKLADVGRKPGKDCNCLLPFPRCCRERMQSPSRDCSTSRIPACVSAGCFYPRGLATFPWKQRRP